MIVLNIKDIFNEYNTIEEIFEEYNLKLKEEQVKFNGLKVCNYNSKDLKDLFIYELNDIINYEIKLKNLPININDITIDNDKISIIIDNDFYEDELIELIRNRKFIEYMEIKTINTLNNGINIKINLAVI